MRDEVIDREREGAEAAFHHHVAHLAHGRITQRLLDIALHQHHHRPHDGGDQPDQEGDLKHGIRLYLQGCETIDQEAARIGDAGMHERRDRRWSFHGVREPGV